MEVRDFNVGNSNYAVHKFQVWDLWIDYQTNSFDSDIMKRLCRRKAEPGMTKEESRIMDFQKIKHIMSERIRQLKEGYLLFGDKNLQFIEHKYNIVDISKEYNFNRLESEIFEFVSDKYDVFKYATSISDLINRYISLYKDFIDHCDTLIKELKDGSYKCWWNYNLWKYT